MTGVTIERVPYDSAVARQLVAATLAEMGERYGGSGDETPVDPAEFEPPDGAFLVARLTGEPVGCGGWRSHGGFGTVAELKRLYTCPDGRRHGVGRQVLAAVEASARAHGRTRLVLECGRRQPEAIRLYRASGYQRIPDFGYYRNAPDVISFGRDL